MNYEDINELCSIVLNLRLSGVIKNTDTSYRLGKLTYELMVELSSKRFVEQERQVAIEETNEQTTI